MSGDLAQRLAAARTAGVTIGSFPKLTLAEGYAVAAELAPMLGTPAGWKVGATSTGAQQFLGVVEPIRGRLYAERIWHGGEVLLVGSLPVEAEPEIVMRVGDRGAIDAAWFGIELNRTSFLNPFALGVGSIVADNAASVGLLLGPAIALDALDCPAELSARVLVDDVAVAQGSADAVLGDPRRAYDWLRGSVDLVIGDLVATGAMTRAAVVDRGTTLVLDCGVFGGARFTLK